MNVDALRTNMDVNALKTNMNVDALRTNMNVDALRTNMDVDAFACLNDYTLPPENNLAIHGIIRFSVIITAVNHTINPLKPLLLSAGFQGIF